MFGKFSTPSLSQNTKNYLFNIYTYIPNLVIYLKGKYLKRKKMRREGQERAREG